MSEDEEEMMSPDESPNTAKPKTGVRKVNNLPLMLFGVMILGFVLVMAYVAAQRAQDGGTGQQEQMATDTDNSTGTAAAIAGGFDGIIEVAGEKNPEPVEKVADNEGEVLIARPKDLSQPPPPPTNLGSAPAPRVTTRPAQPSASEQRRMQQLQAAAQASSKVPVTSDLSQTTQRRGLAAGPNISTQPPQTRQQMLTRIRNVQQQVNSMQARNPEAVYRAKRRRIEQRLRSGS